MKFFLKYVLGWGLFATVEMCLAFWASDHYDVNPLIFVIIAVFVVLLIQYLWINGKIIDADKRARRLDVEKQNWTNKQKNIENQWFEFKERQLEDWEQEKKDLEGEYLKKFEEMLSNREQLYKWLATIIADIKDAERQDPRSPYAKITRNRKRKWDDQLKAEASRKIIKQKDREIKILEYELDYIKTLIPGMEEIVEIVDAGQQTEMEPEYRPDHLSDNEWGRLTPPERDQITLERYKNRHKKNWEIGRDFERYIGWKYEQDGYEVEYFGIEKKLEDLGRDLIAQKGDRIDIVQCKCWSGHTIIHEKHILQLYGTLTMYKIEMGNNRHRHRNSVYGVFATTTELSDVAMQFAGELGIKVKAGIDRNKIYDRPLIKCNIGRGKYGEETRLYHLPMDQQYDTIKIDRPGECYVSTVKEAIQKGFERRAWRWHGAGN